MKLALSLLALSLPAANGFAFVAPSSTLHHSSTSLGASKSTAKKLKREKWAEARGVAAAPSSSAGPSTQKNEGGLEYVTLTGPTGSTSTVYTLGACVTSYVDGGTEFLKVRPDAKMDGSKPISGGLAFCWPQFGPDSGLEGLSLQQHGFARNVDWSVSSLSGDSVTMTLEPNDYTKGMWDKDFSCSYTVTVADGSLDTEFKVKNNGAEAFSQQAALHSYFDVSSLENLSIEGGFKGKTYIDKMDGGSEKTEERDALTITAETDSIYLGVSDSSIVDSGKGKKVSVVTESGWEDCVVWNPHGDEGMGYDTFVCAESVKFKPVSVEAGGEWVGKMKLVPSDL